MIKLLPGRFRRSNDRLRQFHQLRIKGSENINNNTVRQNLSTGDWIALQGSPICKITSPVSNRYKTTIFVN